MNHTTIVVTVGLAFAAALPAVPAMALNAQTFVSGHGDNANSCKADAPCRTFARAHNTTSPGGEIVVLDAAERRADHHQGDQHRQ